MTPLEIVTALTKKYNEQLKADDRKFNRMVTLSHYDGSHFLFMNAFALKYKIEEQTFVIIFSEHHGTRIYDMEDVSSVICKDLEYGTYSLDDLV